MMPFTNPVMFLFNRAIFLVESNALAQTETCHRNGSVCVVVDAV